MKKILISILFLGLLFNSYGQEKYLTLQFKSIMFKDLVDTLEKLVPFKIYYSEKWIDSLYVSVNSQHIPVNEFFDRTFTREGLSYIITEDIKSFYQKVIQ